jgi:hypothetical protein
MKLTKSIIGNFVFRGYASNNFTNDRVIFKTIVSTDLEARYVLMNAAELLNQVDYFLICEANVLVTGEKREFSFYKMLEKYPELQNEKIKLIEMDLASKAVPWDGKHENLFANAFLIRDGFRDQFPIEPSDIVISTDGDEVIFSKSAKKYIRKLRRKILPRIGYLLYLNQIVYKVEYLWEGCDFRAPVISRAVPFLKQEKPQWRDKGTSTFLPSGTHFSWVMTASEMKQKILTTAHRDEYESFADEGVLERAISEKNWIFQPGRPFKILNQQSLHSKCYPRSLATYADLFASHTNLQ